MYVSLHRGASHTGRNTESMSAAQPLPYFVSFSGEDLRAAQRDYTMMVLMGAENIITFDNNSYRKCTI
jgi:hypothetical protein